MIPYNRGFPKFRPPSSLTEPISILTVVSTAHTNTLSLLPVWYLQAREYRPHEVFIQQERTWSCGNLHLLPLRPKGFHHISAIPINDLPPAFAASARQPNRNRVDKGEGLHVVRLLALPGITQVSRNDPGLSELTDATA